MVIGFAVGYFRLLTEYHSFLFIKRSLHIWVKKTYFRLLTEYHSFLSNDFFVYSIHALNFRLLTEYHSFLCFKLIYLKLSFIIYISVSLRSIIHSYLNTNKDMTLDEYSKFPSPYGVSFILIYIGYGYVDEKNTTLISVSLRSIIHSY